MSVRKFLQRPECPPDPAIALNETLRLAALRRYDILDTLPEPVFDDLAAMAANTCDMPFAGVTFVDEQRLWFKSRIGLKLAEVPRETGPCGDAILAEHLLVVRDTRHDARFAQSPLVAGEPHLRFYAGMPLRTADHHTIGTLWVGDTRKRRLSEQSRKALRILAHQVLTQLELRRHLVDLERSLFEHRRTQDALRSSEMFYESLVETLPQNILRKDTTGRFVFANRKFCASLGKSLDQILGKNDLDFFPPQLAEKYHRDDLRVMATREPVDTIEANQTPAGERIFVHVIKTPLYDVVGNVIGIQGIFWDVTERKKTEEALAYERDLLRALLENIPDRIYFKDTQSRFLRVSSSMAARLGVANPADVVGRSDFDFYPKERAQEFHADEQHLLLTGEPLINKLEQIIDQDGRESWASVTKVPLHNKSGNVVGMVGISRDITQLKEAEAALAHARDAALETARMKSEFLANMSHEIRTPMNAIVGMTDLLFDTALSQEQREFLETVRNGAGSLLAIINDILDFSKLEAGKLAIEGIDFDLRELIESNAELLAQGAQQKGIELAYSIDPGVPTRLHGDPGRVSQVLANLLSNAVKFTEHGEVVIRVTRHDDTGSQAVVRIAVTDSGIGIPEKALPLIFQAFTQADGSTSRKYGGTGLGLTISKQIVEAMHGRMHVESVPGRGSTFSFEVPIEKQARQPEEREPEDLRDARTLVVDDNATNRGLVAAQLSRWRLRADTASDATEALERLRSAAAAGDPFAFAVLDMQMAGVDGLTLARTIKEDPAIATTRLIMVTPLGNRPDEELMTSSGISACVVKPIRQSRLLDALINSLHARIGAPQTGSTPAPENPEEEPTPGLPWRDATILLAEDNLVNQRLALRQLAKLGFTALPLTNGLEVVQEVESRSYDVILMDCQMPEVDGYEAARRIRQWEHDHPARTPAYIIAVTAHALDGDHERCLSAGMNDYITKPVHMAQLEAAINRGLKRKVVPAPPASVLDPVCVAGLKQLREPGLADPVAELVELFKSESRKCIERLAEALRQGDAAAAAAAAHSLKGSASNLGAPRLSQLCGQAEKQARTGVMDAVDLLLPEIETQLKLVRDALDAELLVE